MFMKGALILGCILFFYTLFSLIRPLPLRWWWKLLMSLPLGIISFKYPLLYAIWGGHFFRPAAPAWVELGSNWLFMSLLLLVPLLLLLDMGRFPVWLCLRKSLPRWQKLNNRLNLVLLCGVLLLSAYGMHNAFALPEIKEITIHLPHLSTPVKLAMLTDLHADRHKPAAFFQEIVNRTNSLQADAVVITGDFEDGSPEELAPALAPLGNLRSRWGTFAVHGNHDYFNAHHAWEQYLSQLGVHFLNNEHVLLGNDPLVLAGVTDPASRNIYPAPNVARAVHQAPSGKPIVLLAHQPRLATEAARRGVGLQLSGHTHGGHAPGIRQIIACFNEGMAMGLNEYQGTKVYISNGTSLWSGFPLRILTPAEITLIHLVPS